MVPVLQQIDKIPGGDCFRACVASIMEMPIESVPHFCEDGKNDGKWFIEFRSWLLKQDLCAVVYDWRKGADGGPPPQAMCGYCLVSVQSKHPDAQVGWLHSVVGRSSLESSGEMGLNIVHDPNGHRRKNTWEKEEIQDVIWIVKVIG